MRIVFLLLTNLLFCGCVTRTPPSSIIGEVTSENWKRSVLLSVNTLPQDSFQVRNWIMSINSYDSSIFNQVVGQINRCVSREEVSNAWILFRVREGEVYTEELLIIATYGALQCQAGCIKKAGSDVKIHTVSRVLNDTVQLTRLLALPNIRQLPLDVLFVSQITNGKFITKIVDANAR